MAALRRIHFCGDDTVLAPRASHQSLLCFVISLFSLWALFRIHMLCLVPCVYRFVFLLQYCLHCSWIQRTVGSLLLPMRMTNHIRIWQLIHRGWCTVMFYHYLGPESVWESSRPVDRTVTFPVHSNFLSVVDHLHMFFMTCKHKHLDFCEIRLVVLQILLIPISPR